VSVTAFGYLFLSSVFQIKTSGPCFTAIITGVLVLLACNVSAFKEWMGQ